MGNGDGLEEWSAGSQSVFTTGLAVRSHGDSSLIQKGACLLGLWRGWGEEGGLPPTHTGIGRLHFITLGLASSPS